MELMIRENSQDGQHLLYLEGEIDAYTVSKLRDLLLCLVNRPEVKRVAVDLSAVEYIDSTGIGTFVAAMKACKQTGCELAVQNLSPRVERLFRITGLYERMVPHKGESE
ncbi:MULTISPECIES: STAS domain-containing protein [Brevibacillus]|jgi:anti-sigma B factor antagonist|uniref:Anti-sigma factor antagonist n=1 Tax=Brevibacillus borstelensis AK1 TaxID=1300222 RepID=M8E792_9BACL|nr:STAS domain-containing protein [Brevibacillus borstelensis]EMT51335.1 anti-sigma-B factor antagonist [Brevibacillus borstelensis AK1]KKX54870.1 anti-sigma B factor antagonist [Brevibacillus borstelensis cifa_chp40]MBE5395418.1 STAS domain-containing protein [Brevibacillus borstelensis]MCC0566825.1 STAS domain-containing protein [Brevibacillus borstelensis]MCM3472813.1 STAS domain-containing protein [Brevibacillus borstelensis]